MIGAMATFANYKNNEFEIWVNVAYKRFKLREDLRGLTPQEVHVNDEEVKNGEAPKWVKVADNGNSLVLPVLPHQMVPPRHVRVCTPEPEPGEGE